MWSGLPPCLAFTVELCHCTLRAGVELKGGFKSCVRTGERSSRSSLISSTLELRLNEPSKFCGEEL